MTNAHVADAAHEPDDFGIDPAVIDAGTRRRLSGPSMRTFLNIADRWALDETQRRRVLGMPGRTTFHGWAEKARHRQGLSLGLDTLLRISAVLGIYKALGVVFPEERVGIAWLRAPNRGAAFGGQRPIDLMTSGTQDGLLLVRRHLDAWCGGLFAAPNPVDDALPPLDDDDIVIL